MLLLNMQFYYREKIILLLVFWNYTWSLHLVSEQTDLGQNICSVESFVLISAYSREGTALFIVALFEKHNTC